MRKLSPISKQVLSLDFFQVIAYLLKWTIIIFPISIFTGSIVAFFLWMLEFVTYFRWAHIHIIFLLPLAGILITFIYKKFGKNSDAGNNLIIDEIHKPAGGIPFRMAPFIFLSTILTHLFGGSAGREGTAIQMGGSIASLFNKWYKLKNDDRRILLMCGMSAGFGAVFGTPVTGCIFALEVLSIGRIRYDALIPCLIASSLSNFICLLYPVMHTRYIISFINQNKYFLSIEAFDFILLGKVILSGILFGLTSNFFTKSSHALHYYSRKHIKNPLILPFIAGILIIGISYLIGSFDYLGLGVINPKNGVSIFSSFSFGGAHLWSWLIKFILTIITLNMGYKGGEVTPLFFIGATLGNAIAYLGNAPTDLFAGLGFISVFAGATNTPITCTIMGAELFGANNIHYYAISCFTAYYFSGHTGIYQSQRTSIQKFQRR